MSDEVTPGSPGPWYIDGGTIKDAVGQVVCHWQLEARDPQPWHRMDAEFIVAARNWSMGGAGGAAREVEVRSVGVSPDVILGYDEALTRVVSEINRAQARAWQAANAVMLTCYWFVGRTVVELEAGVGRAGADGGETVERLAADLTAAVPGMRGLGSGNLRLMRAFALAWPGGVVDLAVGRLSWTHVVVLLEQVEGRPMLDEWAARAVEGEWSSGRLADELGVGGGGRLASGGAARSVHAARSAEEPVSSHQKVRSDVGLPERAEERAVLRAFARVQVEGGDPYDAKVSVALGLGMSVEQVDGSVGTLVAGGYVTGGSTFAGAFVERVTEEGLAVARWLDAEGRRGDLGGDLGGGGRGGARDPEEASGAGETGAGSGVGE